MKYRQQNAILISAICLKFCLFEADIENTIMVL